MKMAASWDSLVLERVAQFYRGLDTYKQEYGYDFLFVDGEGDIMLSSDPNLIASYSDFTNLSELLGMPAFPLLSRTSRHLTIN